MKAAVTSKPAPDMAGGLTPEQCLNCGQPFAHPLPHFCPHCGQESRVRPPRMGEFLQQLGGAYFSTEGALWRTLKLLLLKPGELTRQYLNGRRKHYVLPLRLYLTISLITLLLVRLAGSIDLELAPNDQAGLSMATRNLVINMSSGKAGLHNGVFFCENLPDWVCKRFKRRLDIDPKAMASDMGVMKDRFLSNLGGTMFVLLPTFALWLKLVYFGRRMYYTEHLVFALHIHAFWFLALAVSLSGTWLLTAPAVLAVPIYTLMAMKRVYGGRFWPRLLRAGVVSALYLMVMTAAITAVGLFTLLS